MQNNEYELILVMTPFCGVCKTILPMVEILAETLLLPLNTCNANEHKQFMQTHKITQVPALILKKEGQVQNVITEITNITAMYDQIQTYISLN